MAQGPLPIPVDARELIRHMEWADSSVLRAVLAHAPAHEDGRLRDLLVHLHGVQAAFLAIWASRALPEPPAEPPTLAQIAAFARGCHAEVPAMIAQWGQADLSRPIRMPGLEPYERQIGRPFDSPTLAENGRAGRHPLDVPSRPGERAAPGDWRRAAARGLHRVDLVREAGARVERHRIADRLLASALWWTAAIVSASEFQADPTRRAGTASRSTAAR